MPKLISKGAWSIYLVLKESIGSNSSKNFHVIFWKFMKKCLKKCLQLLCKKTESRNYFQSKSYCLKSLLASSLAMNCTALIYFVLNSSTWTTVLGLWLFIIQVRNPFLMYNLPIFYSSLKLSCWKEAKIRNLCLFCPSFLFGYTTFTVFKLLHYKKSGTLLTPECMY